LIKPGVASEFHPSVVTCDVCLCYISSRFRKAEVSTLHSLFYLETALHISGGTSTRHQERKQLYLQHLVFVTPLLLSAAIVEGSELVWVCCGCVRQLF